VKWMLLFTALGLLQTNNLMAKDLCDYASSARYEPNPSVDHKAEGTEPFLTNDVIEIPLTVDMAERYDIPSPDGVELDAQLGSIEVNLKTGAMSYNGRDITGDITSQCRDTADENDGYKEPDQEVKRIQGNIFKGQDITKQGKNIADF